MEKINFEKFYKRVLFDVDSTIVENYNVTQNDTKSRGLYVSIYQNGVVVDATESAKLTYYGIKPDGKTIFVDAVIEDDLYRVDFKNQTFNIPGEIKSELTLIGDNGEKITKKMIVTVTPSFITSEPIESSDDFSALQQALSEVASFAGRLEDLDETCEDIYKNIGDLDALTTEEKEDLVSSINELNKILKDKVNVDSLTETLENYTTLDYVGLLEDLTTEEKGSIVAAINHINEKVNQIELENDNDSLMKLIMLKADKKDLGEIKDIKEIEDGVKAKNVVEALNFLIDMYKIMLDSIMLINSKSYVDKKDFGELVNLETESKNDIVSAVNELNSKIKDVEAVTNVEELMLLISGKADRKDIGSLSKLNTNDKTNLVSAINENFNKIKDIELLPGEQGPPGKKGEPGPPGEQGPPGKDGSDATVTKEKIISELGFTPASESVIGNINDILDMINGQ